MANRMVIVELTIEEETFEDLGLEMPAEDDPRWQDFKDTYLYILLDALGPAGDDVQWIALQEAYKEAFGK